MKGVLFVPREIDDLRHDLIPAEQDGVASADASVLTAVELEEVGSGLLCVPDEDRDAETVVWYLESGDWWRPLMDEAESIYADEEPA